MTYKSNENIQTTFDLDQQVFYNNAISLVNPTDLCFDIPFESAKLCIKFYRLNLGEETLSGSSDVSIKQNQTESKRIKLGSFRFRNGSSFLERIQMRVYSNNEIVNSTDNQKANMSSFYQMKEKYDNLLDKWTNFVFPKWSFNFEPFGELDDSAVLCRFFRNNCGKNKNASSNHRLLNNNETQ